MRKSEHKTSSREHRVDFLIVGAARSGTTGLCNSLSSHPDIFIPQRKECQYFSCMPVDFQGPRNVAPENIITTQAAYRRLFRNARPAQLCGDVSPDYLYYHHNAAPKIIAELGAQTPIIIVLRNPIDRAYSNYLLHVRDGWENMSFEDALAQEEQRRAANWSWGWDYVAAGLYAEQVRAYTDNFDRVLLLLFERDVVTGQATEKILNFLNLDADASTPNTGAVNVSGYPVRRWLHRLMTDELIVRKIKNMVRATPFYSRARRLYQSLMANNLQARPMADATRLLLREKFAQDVKQLAQQTGLPMYEHWRDFR